MDNTKPWAPEAKMRQAILKGSMIEAYDEAINMLKSAPIKVDTTPIITNVQFMRSECKIMTASMVDGCQPPELDSLFAHMRENLHDLADNLSLVFAALDPNTPKRVRALADACTRVADISSLISEYRQLATLGSDGLGSIESLCNVLDTQKIAEHEAKELVSNLIGDTRLPVIDREFAVDALCHNLMTRHGRPTVLSLISALRVGELEPKVVGRIAVAIVADMISWPERWMTDRVLLESLDDLVDNDAEVADILRSIFIFFAKPRILPTVERFFNEDMAAEVNAMVSDLVNKVNKTDSSITISEEEADEIFGFKRKGFIDKMAKIEHWKKIGVDIGYTSTKGMRIFPFFRGEFMHWLRPFDPANPDIVKAVEHFADPDKVIRAVEGMDSLPDSDKYAIMLGFGGVDEATFNKLCDAASSADESDNMSNFVGKRVSEGCASALVSADGFVKDLYRAWMLRPDDFGYTPAFSSLCGALDGGLASHLFTDAAKLDYLGSSLVKYECWDEAVKVFATLCERNEADGTVDVNSLRKYAFSLIKVGRTEDGAEQLRRAEIIDDSDAWTKRILAECYVGLGKLSAAAYTVERAREAGTADAKMLAIAALCYTSMRKYDSALKCWTERADKAPSDADSALGIVRCLMQLGRDADAEERMGALLGDDDSAAALRLKALLATIRLKFTEANDILVKLARKEGCKSAVAVLEDDREMLEAHGITDASRLVLADRVRSACEDGGIE